MKSSIAAVVSGLFFVMVMLFIYGISYSSSKFVESIKTLGQISVNFSSYGLILEVLAILLLSSMIGAFYLASKEEEQ